jgi:hypothetical protein
MTFAIDINAVLDQVIQAIDQPAAAATAAAALASTARASVQSARALGGLTLADLVPYSEVHRRAGLYVVFDQGVPVYVGSCRSQSFLVRLPAHLAAFEGDYMNTLAKVQRRLGPDGGGLVDAAQQVATGCSVLLFTANPRWDGGPGERDRFVSGLILLERALQDALATRWNNLKRRKSLDQAVARAIEVDELQNDVDAQEGELDDAAEAAEVADLIGDGAVALAPQWQAAVLAALGIQGQTALVVKVRHRWQAAASESERRDAVVGDWVCALGRAAEVKAVIGVAHAQVVEVWKVDSVTVLANGRVRFNTSASRPVTTSLPGLPRSVLQARGIRYIT